MKKKGISYIEILIALSVFSIGIIPVFFSLNNAFNNAVLNRDYSIGLEHNIQLIEEISGMLPTEVGKGSSRYDSLSEMEVDIRKLISGRDENSTRVSGQSYPKGIYHNLEWTGEKFVFNSGDITDSSMYREIHIGDSISIGEKEVLLPVTIEIHHTNESQRDRSYIASNDIVITLIDETADTDDTLVGEGVITDDKIQIKKDWEPVPGSGSFIPEEEEYADFIRVYLIGNGNNPNKVDEATVDINDSNSRQTLSEVSNNVFEGPLDPGLNPGDSLQFFFKANGGTSNLKEIRYELFKKQ